MLELPEDTQLHTLTGSRYICNPPVMNTDLDVLIKVNEADYEQYCAKLLVRGWERGGSRSERSEEWSSYKKKVDDTTYNYIVTHDPTFYNDFWLATETAKKLNLLKKEDRIALFRAIVDKQFPQDSNFGAKLPFEEEMPF